MVQGAGNAMERVVAYIIDPALLVIFACGFFLFIYGLVEFLWNLNEGKDNSTGKQHMIWGIVGMLVMISVYGILDIIDNTFHLNFSEPDVTRANNIVISPNLFSN